MAIDWINIILFIIAESLKGKSKASAVASASAMFGISESEIWRHGGF